MSWEDKYQAYHKIQPTLIPYIKVKSRQKIQQEADSGNPSLRKLLGHVNLYEKTVNLESLQSTVTTNAFAGQTIVAQLEVIRDYEAFPTTKQFVVINTVEVSSDEVGSDSGDASMRPESVEEESRIEKIAPEFANLSIAQRSKLHKHGRRSD